MARLQAEKPGSPTYRQIWRIVDGAVAQALADHPDYVASGKRLRTVRNSIVKRVTGAITGYAEQSAWVRSGSSPAHDKSSAFARCGAHGDTANVADPDGSLTGRTTGGADTSPVTLNPIP